METISQRELKQRVTDTFTKQFGQSPTRYFQAPGRVNLIGEHTDYNDGFVLPCAIEYQTLVAVIPRTDNKIRVVAADLDAELDEFEISPDIPSHPTQMWSNYVRGVAMFFLQHCRNFGGKRDLLGADMAIAGNVPQGAGLSSSAALEVAIGTTLNDLNNCGVEPATIARIGQQAENDFVGCKCGIMDQMASACGAAGNALMLDCRSLETRLISMPSHLSVMIINSNVKRGLVDSEYNTRRQQCEKAAEWFGVNALRDLDLETFEAKQKGLDPVTAKRARHVISENARTLAAAQALQEGNSKALSTLMAESHYSMQHDFEITVPPIDEIVQIVSGVIGDQGGVRMTGGGFGGCVVALLPKEMQNETIRQLTDNYEAKTGLRETVYTTQAYAGAGEVL